jgi:RNA polymerase sigma factor (sigma-70 family)
MRDGRSHHLPPGRIARAQGRSSASAEDAVQTTGLRLVQRADRIEEDRAVLKWLVTTVRREAWAVSRKGRRDIVSDPIELPEDAQPDALLEVIEQLGRSDVLWTHVRELSERCRRLLVIIAYGDRPDYAAIAEGLGMPVGSIGPTRGRCLAKLRTALEADPQWAVTS